MSIRYIGSKARVVADLAPLIGRPTRRDGVFVDAFCGTGVVAEAAARQGWAVHLNDHLHSAVIMSRARLVSAAQVRFTRLGGYDGALRRLSKVPLRKGFVWREYSPASAQRRMYFTEENAQRIDSIRHEIAKWKRVGKLASQEECVLLADLLAATNRVANIAGTYGCFLSHWTAQARETLELAPREFFPRKVQVYAAVGDVAQLGVEAADLVYLDPPYTKRQYAAYYHILETIAIGDEPEVNGVTGLRPWQSKASDFCYRTRALRAILNLIRSLDARRQLLSYSDEGHVPLEPLSDALADIGRVTLIPLKKVGRYRPNQAASNRGADVHEFVLSITRDAHKRLKAALA